MPPLRRRPVIRRRSPHPRLLVWLVLLAGLPSSATDPPLEVTSVAPGSPAEAAAIEVGDRLLAWSRPDGTGGAIASILDWLAVRLETAPEGPVALHLASSPSAPARTFSLPPTGWGFEVLPAGVAPRLEGLDPRRPETWSPLAGGDLELAWWLEVERGDRASEEHDHATALDAYDLALTRARRLGRALPVVESLRRTALAHERSADLPAAAGALAAAAAEARTTLGPSFTLARILQDLGRIQQQQGDLTAAERSYTEALDVTRQHAPGTLAEAEAITSLGIVAWFREELGEAERRFLDGLEIRRRIAPGSIDEARSLGNLGNLAILRDDLDTAAEYFDQAAVVFSTAAPESLDVANVLLAQGAVESQRGHLATAEDLYLEALAIYEELRPGGPYLAALLQNLAGVESDRHRYLAAEQHYRQALEIFQSVAPDSLDVALVLNNLGVLARRRHDLPAARGFHLRAHEIRAREAPGTPSEAQSLVNLGIVAASVDDFSAARAALGAALAIQREANPGGRSMAATLTSLGKVAREEGRWEEAESRFLEALVIVEQKLPGTEAEADLQHELGRVARHRGDRREAAARFEAAIEALEAQIGELGAGGSTEQSYRSSFLDLYEDLVDLYTRQGRLEAAFEVLERSRARVLLELLAEAPLDLDADLPVPLRDEKRALVEETEALRRELADDRDAPLARLDELRRAFDAVGRRYEDLKGRIRATSPRLAELRYPRPVTAREIQRELDPGTALLAYEVTNEVTHLFALTSTTLRASTLPIGRDALAERVATLRRLVARRSAGAAAEARALYELLLGPAASVLDDVARVVIVPDAALHLVPFGALVAPDGIPLGLARGLAFAQSATVFRTLAHRRRIVGPPGPELVAFGDPDTSGVAPGLFRNGEVPAPLPGTRVEVERIGSLFPNARLFLGPRATEASAKASSRDARYLHFATHGLLDPTFPLESALLLSPDPDRGEDGLLRAAEILDQLDLEADLVTLSACSTALGTEVEGEGLVGLTRAFQHAGARTVVASLWNVDDAATTALVAELYAGLARGLPTSEALRQAQLSLVHGGPGREALEHPFFWAGFQLYGDWR